MSTKWTKLLFKKALILFYSIALALSFSGFSQTLAGPVSVSSDSSTNLQGTWSHCNEFDGTSTEFKWTFYGSKFINIKGDYLNNKCSGSPAHGYSELYSGTYTIGTQVGSSAGMGTFLLDLTIEKAFAMPMAPYGFYTIYSVNKNVLYLGNTRSGPDGFSRNARPSSLQIDNGDYRKVNK